MSIQLCKECGLADIYCERIGCKEPEPKAHVNYWRAGFIVRLSSMWIGIHWSNTNRRLCVNFLPCFTFFVTLANGDLPKLSDYPRRWMIRK